MVFECFITRLITFGYDAGLLQAVKFAQVFAGLRRNLSGHIHLALIDFVIDRRGGNRTENAAKKKATNSQNENTDMAQNG